MNDDNIELQRMIVNEASNNGELFISFMQTFKKCGKTVERSDMFNSVGLSIGLSEDECNITHETKTGMHNYLHTYIDRLTTIIMSGCFGEHYAGLYKDNGTWIFTNPIDMEHVNKTFIESNITKFDILPNDLTPSDCLHEHIKNIRNDGVKMRYINGTLKSLNNILPQKKTHGNNKSRYNYIKNIINQYIVNNSEEFFV